MVWGATRVHLYLGEYTHLSYPGALVRGQGLSHLASWIVALVQLVLCTVLVHYLQHCTCSCYLCTVVALEHKLPNHATHPDLDLQDSDIGLSGNSGIPSGRKIQ